MASVGIWRGPHLGTPPRPPTLPSFSPYITHYLLCILDILYNDCFLRLQSLPISDNGMFLTQVAAYLRESSLPLIIIPAVLVVYILNAVRWVYHSGLRDLPGPSLAPYSELWRIFSLTMKGKAPLEYRKLHKNYGKIVRTGPDTVSISDPAMIPIIYGFNSTYIKVSLCILAPNYTNAKSNAYET